MQDKMMTLAEIASLTGKNKTTVQRWATKVAMQNASGAMQNETGVQVAIMDKLTESARSGGTPAAFDLVETVAIIRAGGNNLLADMLLDNASKQFVVNPPPALPPMSRPGCTALAPVIASNNQVMVQAHKAQSLLYEFARTMEALTAAQEQAASAIAEVKQSQAEVAKQAQRV